jgi:hypothetical protein
LLYKELGFHVKVGFLGFGWATVTQEAGATACCAEFFFPSDKAGCTLAPGGAGKVINP